MRFPVLKFESRVALLVGLVMGLWALAVVPPVITFDAPGHFYRTVQVQRGEFRATRYSAPGLGGEIPEPYVNFCDALWERYWYRHDFGTPAEWRKISADSERGTGLRREKFSNIANYSPLNHAFQAVGFGLAAAVTRSPWIAHLAGCVTNLFGYLLLVVLALEAAPRFERGLLLVATSPLILVQAASLSGDAINVALPLLLLANIWRLREGAAAVTRRALYGTFLLGGAVALLKPTAIVLLGAFVLLPERHFGSWRRKWAALASLGGGALGLWWWWNHPYFDLEIGQFCAPGHPPGAEMKTWFFAAPWRFVPVLGRAFAHDFWTQWPAFFGGVGGWVSPVCYRWMPACSLVFLVGWLGCSAGGDRGDRGWAALLVLQSVALFALMSLVFWLTFGTVGAGAVPGMGGRYFMPVYTGLAVAWAEFTGRVFARFRRPFFWIGLGANLLWLAIVLGSTTKTVW